MHIVSNSGISPPVHHSNSGGLYNIAGFKLKTLTKLLLSLAALLAPTTAYPVSGSGQNLAIASLANVGVSEAAVIGVVLLVLTILGMGLWVSLNNSGGASTARPRSATGLYLKMLISRVGSKEPLTAFLRAIDLNGATFVSSGRFEKGLPMKLSLSSLHQFPLSGADDSAEVDATVVSSKPLPDDPSSCLVKVRFESGSDATKVKEPLSNYLSMITS